MSYHCKHFIIEELVHPTVLEKYGEEESWKMLNTGMLKVIDHLQEQLGTCTINNYKWGGECENSGLRVNYGSAGSAHRFGCAYDLKFKNASVAEVHKYIEENQEELYELGLRRVEHISATPTWTHIDCKPATDKVGPGEIYFFQP